MQGFNENTGLYIAGQFNGTTVAAISHTLGVASIARTAAIAAGSWDITPATNYQLDPLKYVATATPTTMVAASPIGLSCNIVAVGGVNIIQVKASTGGALADASFNVTCVRIDPV